MSKEEIAFHLNQCATSQATAAHFHRQNNTLAALAAQGLALSQLTEAVTLLADALPPAQSLPDAGDAPDTHQDG